MKGGLSFAFLVKIIIIIIINVTANGLSRGGSGVFQFHKTNGHCPAI